MTDQNCLSEKELLGFHSGLLNEDRADAVAAHLEECAACEETLNNLEQQSDTFIERLRRGVAIEYQKQCSFILNLSVFRSRYRPVKPPR